MLESELIAQMAQRLGCSKGWVRDYLRCLKGVVRERIAGGGEVRLDGIGKFYAKRWAQRQVKTVRGPVVTVPETVLPAFKVSLAWQTEMKEKRRI